RGHRGSERAHPRHPTVHKHHAGLFHLFHRSRDDLPRDHPLLDLGFRAAGTLGTSRGSAPPDREPLMKALLQPHRIVMLLIAAGLVLWICLAGRWDWLAEPKYQTLIIQGIWRTIWLMALSVLIGFTLAVPLGLAQASGPWYLAAPARIFCTVIRGTPLLLQVWLLYYGLGSLFPGIPWI